MDKQLSRLTAGAAALALTVTSVIAGGGQSTPAPTQSVITSLSDTVIEASIRRAGYGFEKEEDSDGLMSFHLIDEEENLVCSIYQYRSSEGGAPDSLGMTIGFDLRTGMLWRPTNAWNESNRYAKVHLDRDNDPFLTDDLDVSGGVTPTTLDNAIKRFAEASLKFQEAHVPR